MRFTIYDMTNTFMRKIVKTFKEAELATKEMNRPKIRWQFNDLSLAEGHFVKTYEGSVTEMQFKEDLLEDFENKLKTRKYKWPCVGNTIKEMYGIEKYIELKDKYEIEEEDDHLTHEIEKIINNEDDNLGNLIVVTKKN